MARNPKRFEEIEVFANNDDCVVLATPDIGGGPVLIAIPVIQVDQVIAWMQQARDEILADTKAADSSDKPSRPRRT